MWVSVIIPFYEGNIYINKLLDTLESCKDSLGMFEVIIVNDSPWEKVNINSDNYTFSIKFITNNKNLGIQNTRINGLAEASGKYILFLDQDDLIYPNFFRTQLKIIEENKADVVIGNALIEIADNKKKVFYKNRYMQNCATKIFYYKYINNQIFSPGQCLIKKEAIPLFWKNNIMNINGADDLFLWLLLFNNKKKYVTNPEIVYIHKYTGSNLSYDLDKMHDSVNEMVKLLEKCDDFDDKNTLKKVLTSNTYKLHYRKSNILCKFFLSIKYFRYCIANILYKFGAFIF